MTVKIIYLILKTLIDIFVLNKNKKDIYLNNLRNWNDEMNARAGESGDLTGEYEKLKKELKENDKIG